MENVSFDIYATQILLVTYTIRVSRSEFGDFLLPDYKIHQQQTTIKHWQLRDLILCPKDRSEFFTTIRNNVYKYNTDTQQSTPIFKPLSFSPVAVNSDYGYIAVSGQRSQIVLRSLESDWVYESTIGANINNSIDIFRHANDVKMLLCNNDKTVIIHTLPEVFPDKKIEFHVPINTARVSPNGRILVAAGDSDEVFFYDVKSNDYTRMNVLNTNSGPGFSCCWNRFSNIFAIASQDSSVSVWDIRSTRILTQFRSSQPPPYGSCRVVKFSPGDASDLLVFSEHVSNLNIVDARTFNSKQTLCVSQDNWDKNIAGTAFTPNGDALFVALNGKVLEYDVDITGRRTFPESSVI